MAAELILINCEQIREEEMKAKSLPEPDDYNLNEYDQGNIENLLRIFGTGATLQLFIGMKNFFKRNGFRYDQYIQMTRAQIEEETGVIIQSQSSSFKRLMEMGLIDMRRHGKGGLVYSMNGLKVWRET